MKKETDLPYERFLTFGAECLTEAELLAIIIRTGTKGKSALDLAKEILSFTEKGAHKGLLGLTHISTNDLMKIKGIGEVKAVKLKCIAELSKRIWESDTRKKLKLNTPKTVADYYMERFRHKETEQVLLLMLDGRNQLIADTIISTGSATASILSAREIFRQALCNDAVYIMILHNHPSGDATPSKQDIEISERLKVLSNLMNIPLLDHIIIGDHSYTSLKEQNLL